MPDNIFGIDMIRVMFGVHALHMPGQIVLQDAGRSSTGLHHVSIVGVLTSNAPILSEAARAIPSPHELIVGEVVIQPYGKWSGKNHIGAGLAAIATSDPLYPTGWDVQTLDTGILMPTETEDLPRG